MVRLATREDVGAIATIHVASAADTYWPLATDFWTSSSFSDRERLWRHLITRETHTVVVAEMAGHVQGFACVNPGRNPDYGDIELSVMHVRCSARRCGLGRAMWEYLISRQVDGASLYIETYAELACCSFYESVGARRFRDEPSDYFGTGVRDVVYRFIT